MIGNLNGIIDEIYSDYVILNVNDIGYIVYLSTKTLSICSVESKVQLLIEAYVNSRENTTQLFGFHKQRRTTVLALAR